MLPQTSRGAPPPGSSRLAKPSGRGFGTRVVKNRRAARASEPPLSEWTASPPCAGWSWGRLSAAVADRLVRLYADYTTAATAAYVAAMPIAKTVLGVDVAAAAVAAATTAAATTTTDSSSSSASASAAAAAAAPSLLLPPSQCSRPAGVARARKAATAAANWSRSRKSPPQIGAAAALAGSRPRFRAPSGRTWISTRGRS